MATLLEQLIREHGDEAASRISAMLGISREEAAAVLPATAAVVLERFAPGPQPSETPAAEAESLDAILDDTGEALGDRVGGGLGLSTDQLAKVVPVLVPLVLRFLVRRVPYGGAALSLLSATVQKQGYGSLDEIALRLARNYLPTGGASGQPGPSLATRLGRFAGKWFPSGEG